MPIIIIIILLNNRLWLVAMKLPCYLTQDLLAVVPDATNSKEADVEDGDYVTWIPPPQIPKQG